MIKPTKWHVRPAKTQISLGIRPVWSESSLSAWIKLGTLATHWAHSEDSDQTGGCPAWSESSLGAQSFCWFCHEAANVLFFVRHDRNVDPQVFFYATMCRSRLFHYVTPQEQMYKGAGKIVYQKTSASESAKWEWHMLISATNFFLQL